ncbi:zinc finger protein 576, tandem duplicate 1 [Enoplosus armatus]|uniref:zinc finger protein 576, tandem duplicate 1 n=1 Tax=Enoplosus armatus TaxID=215367 RepID=UPI003996BCCA
MQSPTQSNSGPNPVTTATTEQPLDTETEAQPAQSEPDAQEEENKSAATAEAGTPITPQENGTGVQTAETPACMAVTQAVENEPAVQPLTEPSVNTGEMEMDSASKPSAPTEPVPDTNTNPGCDGQKAKKQDKGVRDGRKYVPSKKAMVDPLKMDMSKPLVMPLTSSQLSLQCIECHIIFSDHKSKERHLKLSHPAEYEQCILRNALFACYVCDRHFTNSTELMVHQKAHTEKKPFKCPICGQAFNKSSELTLHKKIHFGLDGYACTDCGKPCKTMTLLKYHRRTHTGERPYVCKDCGKRFTMSKALQKHMVSHLPEGAEGDGGDTTAKGQLKRDDGASTKYPCSVCKATFKSTKTRLHHIKTKHSVLPAAASNALQAGLLVKQSTPIITPISICQPALLQVEPNGPLQKVDANIDTEQIRRLIESLGNVQKVNQVVILGQPNNAKDGKRKKNLAREEKVNTKTSAASADIPGPHITQDALLLLKGHKQPQLKVYKLDPSKVSRQSPETLPTKPKTTRKRKASLKVETEGVITSSYSKRALECKDCGERFSEVSSLQKHKMMVHIVESPGLTYTNGNIFEGVSSTSAQTRSSEIGESLASDEDKREGTQKNPSSESEVQGITDEDIKEDLLLEVDLITVGEQNERDDPASCETDTKISKPETSPEFETNKSADPATSLPSMPSTLEESPEEQVVFELESVTTSVEEVMNERGLCGGEEHDRDQSPGIILEKFLTSRQRATADKELCPMTARNNQRQEESSLMLNEVQATQGSRHIRWNVEPVNIENTSSPLTESGETTRDCRVTPEFNTNQCIFYPVKEEEREVLLEAAQTNSGNLTLKQMLSGSIHQTSGTFSSRVLMKGTLPTSTSQLQTPREENRNREPIDYFSKYFGWDTWIEIANCTNKLSNMPNPATVREVAQFVGIHIAMGTLKFPSPRLYWENLTMVPLIAEAMPLSRFLELSRMLKLASPAKDPGNSSVWEGRHDSDFQNVQQGNNLSYDTVNDMNSLKTQIDPLWKTQPLLCRFKAGCQSLRRDGDYAVDQYPLPLTGKMHNKNLSLHCTTLIGFGGLLLHVDLKLGLSDKEDAVEKMVPKGSMVFLCKQELSTPAMLERLLVAGVHGAGRVGGARGQIGDEFVSSNGKLMLRRSHCGFILSTAGNCQRNMTSLIDNFEKAQISAHLNRDLLNLYSIPLTASAPTCWPQAVLWYLTDLALVNSWLLYRQDHRAASAPLTLMAFRLEVSKALILSSGSDTQDSVPPQPPTENPQASNETPNPSLVEESPLPDAATRYDGSGHWPEQLREGEGGRCRFGDCQRTSRVLCLKCCVFLCISRNHNCFLNFHNQSSFGKE